MNRDELYRAIGGADDALLTEFEANRQKKSPAPWKRWGALAACAAVLLGGALLWKPWRLTEQPSAPTEASVPTSATATEAPTETDAPQEPLPELVFTDDGYDAALDIALPKGYFIRELTAEQIAAIWGQEALSWEGASPDVSGEVIYDGTGTPWVVRLDAALDGVTLRLELSPGRLPPQCTVIEGGETCDFYGTGVTAHAFGDYATVDFLRGEGEAAVGVRLTLNPATDALKELSRRAVSQSLRPDATLDLLFLRTDDVPEWRSESLDEAQAYADATFGAYLPTDLPENYVFTGAWRELGDDRDWLSISWSDGQGNELNLEVSRPDTVPALVHADQPQAYVWDYYGAEKPDVPEEYYETWIEPVFYRDEVTPELLLTRVHPNGDSGTCAPAFGIYHPDGTVLTLHAYGSQSSLTALFEIL